MIKYYYKSLRSEALQELKEPKRGTWVHVETPSEEEIEKLTASFKLELGYLEDALDEDEVPRLEREGEQSYIFVRYAYKNSEGDMDTAPLLIVFGSEMVLTISPIPLPAAEALLKRKAVFATT
ncbi:MAG: CorA family divalent cation transporter, partial [Candidatus Saccharimonadales bacterium]